MLGSDLAVRCSAHTSAGNPCKNRPINGSNVCRVHGGSAPQVRAKAQERINAAADSAAKRLIEWMNDKRVPYNIRLQAARDLLDRAQIGTDKTLTVELKPFEQNLDALLVDVDDPHARAALPLSRRGSDEDQP